MPPQRSAARTPRDLQKADTFRRILEAARHVFFEEGFQRATLEQVALRAGVAKGTLYRHVASKAELYVAVLAGHFEIFETGLAAALEGCATPLEKLRGLAEFYIDFLDRASESLPVFWAIDHQSMIGEVPDEFVDQLKEFTRGQLEVLEKVIREGVETGVFVECDSWLMANLLWTVADSYTQLATSPARRQLLGQPLVRAYRQGIELVLRGLLR